MNTKKTKTFKSTLDDHLQLIEADIYNLDTDVSTTIVPNYAKFGLEYSKITKSTEAVAKVISKAFEATKKSDDVDMNFWDQLEHEDRVNFQIIENGIQNAEYLYEISNDKTEKKLQEELDIENDVVLGDKKYLGFLPEKRFMSTSGGANNAREIKTQPKKYEYM